MDEKYTEDLKLVKAKEKEKAVAAIEGALSAIENEQRVPSRWEKLYLISGISAIHAGLYPLAVTDAQLCYAKENERLSDEVLSKEYDGYNIQVIRQAFEMTKLEDLILHPYFFGRK